jgi:hypothetical protein
VRIQVTTRVDSIGRIAEQSLVIEGNTSQWYRQQAEETAKLLKFRPALLVPDNCSVSGKIVITFTSR